MINLYFPMIDQKALM